MFDDVFGFSEGKNEALIEGRVCEIIHASRGLKERGFGFIKGSLCSKPRDVMENIFFIVVRTVSTSILDLLDT